MFLYKVLFNFDPVFLVHMSSYCTVSLCLLLCKHHNADEKPTVVDTPVEPEQEVGVTTTKSAPITWGLPTRPSTIYQEPMKKNSLFIGGLTWVRSPVAMETP